MHDNNAFEPIIVADIGGTNARFALVTDFDNSAMKFKIEQNQNLGGIVLNNKPNVFYIITDAMGSFDNLNKYNIDTTSIDNYLTDNNYQIAYNAKSSYTETRLTLSSIFYLNYEIHYSL